MAVCLVSDSLPEYTSPPAPHPLILVLLFVPIKVVWGACGRENDIK